MPQTKDELGAFAADHGNEDGCGSVVETLSCDDLRLFKLEYEMEEVENIQDAVKKRFSRLPNLRCGRFIDAGMAHHINIYNECSDNMQIKVRWVGRNYDETLSYRLKRGRGRLIRARGQSGAIIDESPWNFSYGTDVIDRLLERHRNVEGGKLWQYWNTTSFYVCVAANIFKDGSLYGNSVGIAEPNETLRVWYTVPGEDSHAFLFTARADPL